MTKPRSASIASNRAPNVEAPLFEELGRSKSALSIATLAIVALPVITVADSTGQLRSCAAVCKCLLKVRAELPIDFGIRCAAIRAGVRG